MEKDYRLNSISLLNSLTPLEISLTPKRALLRIELHANRVTEDNILMSILKQTCILIT